jgi:hypothetical protein
MIVVLTLVTFNIALFLDPVITFLAYFHRIQSFSSEITSSLIS